MIKYGNLIEVYNNNNITLYCARMALCGSRSSVSNSLTHVSRVLKCDRYDIREINHAHIVKTDREETYIIATSVIRDLLTMKYDNMYIPEHQRYLNNIDIQYMLTLLCTM